MSKQDELIDKILKVRINNCREIFTGISGRALSNDTIEFTKGEGRNTPPKFRWNKSLNAIFGKEVEVKVVKYNGYLVLRIINGRKSYDWSSLTLDMVTTKPEDAELVNRIEKCNLVMSL